MGLGSGFFSLSTFLWGSEEWNRGGSFIPGYAFRSWLSYASFICGFIDGNAPDNDGMGPRSDKGCFRQVVNGMGRFVREEGRMQNYEEKERNLINANYKNFVSSYKFRQLRCTVLDENALPSQDLEINRVLHGLFKIFFDLSAIPN